MKTTAEIFGVRVGVRRVLCSLGLEVCSPHGLSVAHLLQFHIHFIPIPDRKTDRTGSPGPRERQPSRSWCAHSRRVEPAPGVVQYRVPAVRASTVRLNDRAGHRHVHSCSSGDRPDTPTPHARSAPIYPLLPRSRARIPPPRQCVCHLFHKQPIYMGVLSSFSARLLYCVLRT